MKQQQLIVNAILGTAIAVLFILHFSGNDPIEIPTTDTAERIETPVETAETEEEVDTAEVYNPDFSVALNASSGLPIAYVDMDKLNAEYAYIEKLRTQLAADEKRLSGELEKKYRSLESDYAEFMKAVERQLISEQDAMARQQSFQQQQMKFEEERQTKTNELLQKQQGLQIKLQKKLSDYLKRYSKEFNYSYILATGPGSNVLYADDSLNITNEVLAGLNSEYKSKK